MTYLHDRMKNYICAYVHVILVRRSRSALADAPFRFSAGQLMDIENKDERSMANGYGIRHLPQTITLYDCKDAASTESY